MGDFADMETSASIEGWRGGGRMPFWPSEGQAGKPLHPIYTQRPVGCRRCGYHFLFWHKHSGKWRLHHYALLPGEGAPRFVLHRCGYTSDGKIKDPRDSGRLPKGEDTGTVAECEASQSGDSVAGASPNPRKSHD
jgi:hypothetical protein